MYVFFLCILSIILYLLKYSLHPNCRIVLCCHITHNTTKTYRFLVCSLVLIRFERNKFYSYVYIAK